MGAASVEPSGASAVQHEPAGTTHDSTRRDGLFRPLVLALRLSRSSLPRYLAVIVVLQLLNAVAIIPAIEALFGLALRSSALTNVTDGNLGTLLADPVADLLLAAIAAIALIALSLQLSVTLVMVNRQQAGLPLNVRGVAFDTMRAIRRVVHYQSPILLTYFFLLAPLGGLGLLSVLTQGVRIPPFVTREFMKTVAGGTGYVVVIGLVIYLNLRLILTLPMLVVGGKSPLRALGNSLLATRRQFWRFIIRIGVPAAAAALTTSIIVEALIWVSDSAAGLDRGTGAAVAAVSIAIGRALGFLFIGAATVVITHVLVAVTREHLGSPSAVAPPPPARASVSLRVLRAGSRTAVVALMLTAGLHAAPAMASPVAGAANTVILAHRGYGGGGVENTIGALDAAAKLHPDYVEADMQETKDGYFVASHDSNLLMVAGRNENIYDMTVKEATAVTEAEGGFTGTIPTMTEYVKRAAALKVPLLIELKVTGHESADYIDRFLAELDATGTTDQNIYHSLSADVVRELKERRPELQVGYTIAMSIGAVPDVDCDFIVLEQASFSTAFLREAHAQGKPVYVWTVDDESTIRDFLHVPVDGIVTDIPDVALRDRAVVADNPKADYRVDDALNYLDLFR